MPRLFHLPLLVLSLAGGCVGGTDVFQSGADDGGTMACERPEPALVTTGVVLVEGSSDERLFGVCQPPLAVDGARRAQCTVLEAVPTAAGGCAGRPARARRGDEVFEGSAWEICEVSRADEPGREGWWYGDLGSGETSAIATACELTGQWIGLDPPLEPHQIISWACTTTDLQQGHGLGAPCVGHEDRRWRQCGIHAPSPLRVAHLICDAVTDQCAVPCESDADCAAVGLEGEHCAERGVCVPDDCS